MADPLYTGDFFIDGNFSVKQEPLTLDSNGITASMPIPTRKIMDMPNLREYGFEFIDDSSPSTSHENGSGPTMQSPGLYQPLNANSMWCVRDPEIKCETFKMDDDDIFQVDKADLIQGPTLAELNANDENLLEDLNFDDLLLPEENSYFINVGSESSPSKTFSAPPLVQITNSCPNNNFQLSSFPTAGLYKDNLNITSEVPSSPMDPFLMSANKLDTNPSSKHSSTSSLLLQSATSSTPPPQAVSPLQQKHSTLHELLLRKEKTEKPKMGQSVPGRSVMDIGSGVVTRQGRGCPATVSRLSSSAPTHLGLDQIWQRREPRQHLLSTGSLAEAGSTSSLSTGGVLSPESHDFSHDEGFDSEDDSDHYEDFSSDEDGSMMSDTECPPGSSATKSSLSKKERYFWQYNVQAKGPKGQRLVLKTKQEDPHVLNEVTDPVFSPSCSVRGIKHSGKARKGDGNDLTPNPRKLASIGKELDKLSRVINDMTPVSEVPFNVRPKTRKEKNKLASRACRLKKKAQHEANKLKLTGLESEHKRLNQGIFQLKQLLVMKYKSETPSQESQEEMEKLIEKIVKSATKIKIAGHSTEFVNRILEKVRNGVPVGGLEELQPI